MNDLLTNLNQLHTTELGMIRILSLIHIFRWIVVLIYQALPEKKICWRLWKVIFYNNQYWPDIIAEMHMLFIWNGMGNFWNWAHRSCFFHDWISG